jgi:hypothetical protein
MTTLVVLAVLVVLASLVLTLEVKGRMNERWVGVAIDVLGFVLAALVWADWGVGRFREEKAYFQGSDIPVIGTVSLVISLAVVLIGILAALGRVSLSMMTAVPAMVIGGVTSAYLIVCETISRLIPSFFIPKTVRRLTLDVGAGEGAWLCLPVAAAAILCLSGRLTDVVSRAISSWSDLVLRPSRVVSYLVLIVSIGLMTISRYMPWISIDTLERDLSVPGWAVPFGGPSTLFAVLALYISCGIYFFQNKVIGLVLFGLSASFVAIVATVCYTTSIFADGSFTAEWVVKVYEDLSVGVDVKRGAGPLVMFLAAVAGTVSLSFVTEDV